MKKLVVFGTGINALCASCMFDNIDSPEYQIVAFCSDDEDESIDSFCDREVISTKELLDSFPPDQYFLFVAIGYHDMNSLRKEKFLYFKEKGYQFASYLPSQFRGKIFIGENSIVYDEAIVQPFAKVGANCIVWGGALLGHHCIINDHCWISGGASIGGCANIKEQVFIGLDSTINESVVVGERTLVGAKAYVSKCTNPESVMIEKSTLIHRLGVSDFLKLTKFF